MRWPNSSPPPLGSILLLLLTLSKYIACIEDAINDEVVIVPLETLPEPFSQEKLPNWSKKQGSKCDEFLGCIERLPDLKVIPQDASIIGTKFKILTKNQEQIVDYKPNQNCLQDSSHECQTYPYNLSSLIGSNFNPNLKTIILIPGYMSSEFDNWVVEIYKIWIKLEEINCIMVSWTGGNKGLYSFAAANTKLVARQITVLLHYLAQLNGLELSDESFTEKIHLIGHSLGAHMAGFVGQDLGGKVGRITGLDAAGPSFSKFNQTYRLDRGDAQLVDAIHTNGGDLSIGQAYYGIEMPIGHLDYYANDGKHQPGCKFNSFGCSHNAATRLLGSILKHELNMREKLQMLNLEYHNYHRIYAYRSQEYESFHNGTSLSKNCPITTLDDGDLLSKDIRNCLIPVDFITWFDRLKGELEQDYGIDFNPVMDDHKLENKFFFYTSAQVPYLNHHNLIRIRVTKSPNLKNNETLAEGCDIMLEIKMANGMGSEHEIKRYNLLDEGDHYEIIVPFLSPNTFSKYSLAELDVNDFYLDHDRENLQILLAKIFPSSIVINGLVVGTPKPTKGMFDTLLGFLNIAKNRSRDQDVTHHCSLNIESVAVQPMKKLHRKMVAIYSVGAKDKEKPDLVHQFREEDSTTLKIPVLPKGQDGVSDLMASEIYIDTVVIGPKEDEPDRGNGHIDEETQEGDNQPREIETKTNTETSSISGSVWLKLTILTLILTMVGVSIFLYRILTFRSEIPEDKTAFVV